MSIQKSEIQLDVNGKKVNAYLAAPDNGGPSVLLLHAWWGLKPFFKETCDRLAEQGFTVLAPDLRDGQIAKTIEEAKALMEKSDGQLVGDTVMAAKDHLRGLTNGKIGVVGFSMGGAWALITAAYKPEQIAAVVLFYGNEGIEYGKVTAKVMGHYSDNDEWEPNEYVENTFAEFKKAGVDATLHIYPGVAHWFVESDRPEYDSASAQLAWERTFEFLKQNVK
ncbi:MAG: dienelactone hydrolase family protein [Anaerolineae bacterium]|nr:dienelactone hydrolase family protein [Anaerolineae bacterium]MBL8107351.1 dienelactone hydrolase family protein [Anaerolineales bacterium]MCC7187826.1 dienelactone hydrolase family protein [Anaerolineales bacterium]